MAGFDHFDFLAPLYERVIRQKEPTRLVELAQLPTPGYLLDAGGGTGRIAETLRSHAGTLVIADLSYGMLQQAVQKKGLAAVNSHAELLPFKEDLFDAVIMVDALHHVCDQGLTARELFRVLKPGGRLVIEEPDIRKFGVKIIALLEKLALMRSRFLTPDRISQLFTGSGAQVSIATESYQAWIVVEKLKEM